LKRYFSKATVKEMRPTDYDLDFMQKNGLEECYPVYKIDRHGRLTDEIVGRVVPAGKPGKFLLFQGWSGRGEANEIIRFDHVIRRGPNSETTSGNYQMPYRSGVKKAAAAPQKAKAPKL
jgi:hypothetical protein